MTRGTRKHWFTQVVLPRVVRGLVAAVLFSIPVFALALLVREQWHGLVDFDQRVAVRATNFTRSHGLTDDLVTWQTWTHPKFMYAYAIPFAIWTWVEGLRARTIWGVVTMLVGWNLGLQAKEIVQRARPVLDQPLEHAPGYSFPSGHAFNAAMMTTTLLIMVWPLLRRPAVRACAVLMAVVITGLTMLDRVFLGVHFASDVTAGLLLALSLSFASYLGFTHTPKEKHV